MTNMITSRITDCPECDGVMRSGWSDGKTRIHAMTCQRCGHRLELHQQNLKYIEGRHFDPFGDIDVTDLDYEEYVEAYEHERLRSTNEAFTPSDGTWLAVKVGHNNDGSFTVAAYDEFADGEGVGGDNKLPYGTPEVSWTAQSVYLNDSRLRMVDLNDGSAWVYFTYVSNITVEDDGAGQYIRLSV